MHVYTVQKGDSLWKIAKAHHIGLDALLAANPQISDPNFIMAGSQINIPEMWCPDYQMQPPPAASQPPQRPQRPACPPCGPANPPDMDMEDYPSCLDDPEARPCIYEAHEGETLIMICQIFMVPITRLLYYNLGYAKDEPLAEGTRIIIPECMIMPVNPIRSRGQSRRRR